MSQLQTGPPVAELRFAADLRLFLHRRYRQGPIVVSCDGVSTLGHLVQSAGVPLTEVGVMAVNRRPAMTSYRPHGGDLAEIAAVARPQALGTSAGFVLDVHLGTLARRLRLLGLDTAYANDADDDALIREANEQRRVLLTQDRGLLCRRPLTAGAYVRGAYVRGAAPDAQLADVLDRFAPPLAPWTRCLACNGLLAPVTKVSVDEALQPGTRRTYQEFARCLTCAKVYWRGAHARRLQSIIDSSM